jgi:hypothetical protein
LKFVFNQHGTRLYFLAALIFSSASILSEIRQHVVECLYATKTFYGQTTLSEFEDPFLKSNVSFISIGDIELVEQTVFSEMKEFGELILSEFRLESIDSNHNARISSQYRRNGRGDG